MEESRQIFNRYHDKLNPVDKLYERIFQLLGSSRFQLSATGRELSGTISARINEFSEALRTLSDSSKELPDTISTRMNEVSEALARYRLQLSSTGKELPEAIAAHINEASEALRKYRLQDIRNEQGNKRVGLCAHKRGERGPDEPVRFIQETRPEQRVAGFRQRGIVRQSLH